MSDWLQTSTTIAYTGLLLGVVMAFIRLILGPTLADRVIALDLIAFITVGFIAVYALDSGQQSLLDVAITLGLVAFLGTIAFARLIFKRKGEAS
ncbi:cation:proton antiporter [Vibrio coralliilyticus]|uniref:cation:proton antiporter n=1 Tax=Vibrio coralliilyticus TaxID=190893 RepID=UPI000512927D|nr:cation:proton antiporter [Vibrio coralliilyticus]